MPSLFSRCLLFAMGVMSLLLFAVMGVDKSRARSHKHRIPESTLFLLALLGGGTGGVLGMYLFRHKTRHRSFTVGFPLFTLLQWALFVLALFG